MQSWTTGHHMLIRAIFYCVTRVAAMWALSVCRRRPSGSPECLCRLRACLWHANTYLISYPCELPSLFGSWQVTCTKKHVKKEGLQSDLGQHTPSLHTNRYRHILTVAHAARSWLYSCSQIFRRFYAKAVPVPATNLWRVDLLSNH